MTGSDGAGPVPPEELRVRQERELGLEFALATMEDALAREAWQVGLMLRESGLELDPLTFVVMRVIEVCTEELIDPTQAIGQLAGNGSLKRSAVLAMDLLDRDAA